MRKLIYLCALILLFGGVGGAAIIEVPEAVAWMSPAISGGGVPVGESCTVDNDSQQYAFETTSDTARTADATLFEGGIWAVGTTYDITGISLHCQWIDSSSGTVTLHLYEYDTVGDAPTGDEVGSITVDTNTLPASHTEHFFEFASAITLTADTDYCFYFVAAGGGKISLTYEYSPITANRELRYDEGWAEGTDGNRGLGVYGCAP
ncbi:MAG: hypothetical protein KAS32_14035 [Candidatus Peribacteraceae bacterium]|nr:hypothetical protein [Candidatus Peribacteraceae bacterium]